MKILILASNPRKDLNLDDEIRDLQDVIEKSRNRQEFEVEIAPAVRVGDLQDLLHRHQPQIVHFCGHGSGQQGLVFKGKDGGEQWVRAEALSDLFRLFSKNVGCVLLNACYSEEQANAIVNHIDYVIGMNQEIRDDAAIAFSKGFYRALGYECSIEQAYEFGKNAIQLEISGSSKMRSTATEEVVRKAEVVGAIQSTAIPEHLKPILKTKPTLAPSARANITAPDQPLSPETRAAIQVDIDQSLKADTKVKQYRDRVREFLSDRKLSTLETIRLDRLRKDLGLSETEANRILTEEQEPIRKAQDEYGAMLLGLIEAGHYPLDAATQAELLAVRQELGLSDEEVAAIATPILAAAEEDYRARLAQEQHQEYEQKLKRYEQEFSHAIEAQYPIKEAVRTGLINFQQSLGLHDEDVARIEQPLNTPKEAEYQRQQEEQRRLEEAKHKSPLKEVEFQIATINFIQKLVEKPRSLGNRTETLTAININYRQGQAKYSVEDLGNGITLEMVFIPGGSFQMGSPNTETDRRACDELQHPATLKPFLMGKYAVTQSQWKVVADLPKVNHDLNPDLSNFKGAKRPVDWVSWREAVEFCDRLSHKIGSQYRLPSEVEWEYACRAGTTTPFHFGETITSTLANYAGIYTYHGTYLSKFEGDERENRGQTTEVGSFPPNALGLYDMHGNVWEWCEYVQHKNYDGAPTDESIWNAGGEADKMLRGGSWNSSPSSCRSAFRFRVSPVGFNQGVGFRVVVVLA